MRAFGPAVHNRRKPSRKGIPQYFLGGVAVTGLVLGCAWTVYTNVIGASVYPSVNSAAFEAPVVKNPTVVAARSVRPAFNEIFASLRAAPAGDPRAGERRELADVQRAVCRVGAARRTAQIHCAATRRSNEVGGSFAAGRSAEGRPGAEACRSCEAEGFRAGYPARVERSGHGTEASRGQERGRQEPPEAKTATASGSTVRDMAQRAKAAVMSIASSDKQTMVEKLWGKQPAQNSLLALRVGRRQRHRQHHRYAKPESDDGRRAAL